MEGNYRDIFTYKDRYQDTPTKDGEFYDCTFLIDYKGFKKGDYLEVISFDWQDHSLYILDEGRIKYRR
jgi:hypothetical protein